MNSNKTSQQYNNDDNEGNNNNNKNKNKNNNNNNSNIDNKVLPERFEEVEKFCETKLTTVSNRSCSEGFQFAVVIGETFESEI